MPLFLNRRRAAGSSLIPTLLVVTAVVTFVSLAGSLTSQFGRMASMQQGTDEAMAGRTAPWNTLTLSGKSR